MCKPMRWLMSISPDSCRLAVTANSDRALSMRAPRRAHLAFRGRTCQQARPRLRLTARAGKFIHLWQLLEQDSRTSWQTFLSVAIW